MHDNAIIEESHQGVATLRLNRPRFYNAFDLPMVQGLARILIRLARDPETRGIIITGQGKAFCAGGDLRWAHGSARGAAAAFHELAAHFHQAIVEIRRMPKPVVAALNGPAAGGGFSLALACDFRIMSRTALLQQGYTSSGLSIDGGGTFHLARLVGFARALEIAALDAPIDAPRALDWGLVTEIAEPAELPARANVFLEDVLKRPLSSFAASKKLLTEAFETPLEVQLEKERGLLTRCAEHPDGQEGVAAFVEKRSPRYNRC